MNTVLRKKVEECLRTVALNRLNESSKKKNIRIEDVEEFMCNVLDTEESDYIVPFSEPYMDALPYTLIRDEYSIFRSKNNELLQFCDVHEKSSITDKSSSSIVVDVLSTYAEFHQSSGQLCILHNNMQNALTNTAIEKGSQLVSPMNYVFWDSAKLLAASVAYRGFSAFLKKIWPLESKMGEP
jgi:hypothetical protein